ncbi:DUF3261 domain-containing protein [Aerolutibacter ruishenii]|uniref:Uncharacterized protein DUF3261 n=1 Tax=Aerolutibacter ruishenii TaxID=686800 RepID=A0A562M052_9GAMM|nr:DUF3261 domain-containing protein [Lysobacter ruishenii]TWI13306.1 uncharacterized protein DUF3261 [Lysobacter ruishenii]
MRRLIAALLAVLVLAACAHAPPRPAIELPPLRLSPASLGREVAVQQQLHFSFGTQARDMDALLEVEAGEVRLVVQAMGQAGVRLFWDGQALRQQRAAWLPPAVRAERVLDDLQFALWPVDAIRRALPPGWTLHEAGDVRQLMHDGRAWLSVARGEAGGLRLENLAEGYRLDIATIASEDATPGSQSAEGGRR